MLSMINPDSISRYEAGKLASIHGHGNDGESDMYGKPSTAAGTLRTSHNFH
jgi:hypothetical protein